MSDPTRDDLTTAALTQLEQLGMSELTRVQAARLRLDELRSAVDKIQPLIDAHFEAQRVLPLPSPPTPEPPGIVGIRPINDN